MARHRDVGIRSFVEPASVASILEVETSTSDQDDLTIRGAFLRLKLRPNLRKSQGGITIRLRSHNIPISCQCKVNLRFFVMQAPRRNSARNCFDIDDRSHDLH